MVMLMLRAFFTLVCFCLIGTSAWAELRADRTDVNTSTGKAIVSVVFPAEIKGDLYLAFNLNGQLYFYNNLGTTSTKVTPFIRNASFSKTLQVLTVSSDGVPSGVYPLYQVVTIPDGDPLNFSNWIGGLGGLSTLNFRINIVDKPTDSVATSASPSPPQDLVSSSTSDCIVLKIQSRITKLIIARDKIGGEDGSDSDDESYSSDCKTVVGTATTQDSSSLVGSTTNATLAAQRTALGKDLYRKVCASCHGSNAKADQNNVMKGRDPLKIRSAIRSDKGGLMGILRDVTDTDLQVIAEYLKSL